MAGMIDREKFKNQVPLNTRVRVWGSYSYLVDGQTVNFNGMEGILLRYDSEIQTPTGEFIETGAATVQYFHEIVMRPIGLLFVDYLINEEWRTFAEVMSDAS